jgi:hypothetical protein
MKRKDNWTFSMVYETWLNGLPDETAKAYGSALRGAREECSPKNFLAVREEMLWQHIKTVSSKAMQRRIVSALHSFFAVALDVGAVDADPSRRVKLRLLGRETEAELLSQIGYGVSTTWSEVIQGAEQRSHGRSEAAQELERRLLVRLRKCRTALELRATLREKVIRER